MDIARNNDRRPLSVLEGRNEFIRRHIGPDEDEVAQMLAELGLASIEALMDEAVPEEIRCVKKLDLQPPSSEAQTLNELAAIANSNLRFRSFIGQGYYGTHTPAVILRNVLENPAWYTAYTPYQPEISQGRLELLLNFQTMITELTALDVANASLLDEATAAAEAMTFCRRCSRNAGNVFFVSSDCFEQTIEVVRTRAEPLGIEIVVGDHRKMPIDSDCFGVLLQYPAADGSVHDYRAAITEAHHHGALAVVAADIMSLALLLPPGELGADVAVGSTQRFGVPMAYGGPHAAYFATRESLKRQIPGRMVGVSIDANGAQVYRLALQTREQHIRREKATSNICTSQVLLANIAALYACYHGPAGLRRIAERIHRLTAMLAAGLEQMGLEVVNDTAFDTLTVRVERRAAAIHTEASAHSINLRIVDKDQVGISIDETSTSADITRLWSIFSAVCGSPVQPQASDVEPRARERLPRTLKRTGACLMHPIFGLHHSETEMLRYITTLAQKDLALDRTMIPLGSCTMKLNSAAEMLAVTWPQFSSLHPFAPPAQAAGYHQLFGELEQMLCACTGYDAVSLQPNAGSQGEYAGLLAIRAWHASRGETHRNVCLIPSSAHGTNPASAQMIGMQVVVVACDAAGNVDVEDLQAKVDAHGEDLAAMMITYPSTHGVFEARIREVCEIVHAAGGQVYVDGANMNALVGLVSLAEIGGDVSHINLHKTFCIPHGGGGPGVGPIGVKAHLAPFLPRTPLQANASVGPVSAAPWGSAGILPISWAYVRMMGAEGLTRATQIAILNANYIASRLADYYPVLYAGDKGRVAHECILDMRPIDEKTGITVEDVAKRLIDYGFHAPTMSFPVAGTFMIEPTESESKIELDRFCDAMIAIAAEIDAVADGRMDAVDNPLKNAPHTAASIVGEWAHPYSREQAVFPLDALVSAKYWPPVGRVDNAWGDRNLVCSCPPLSAYA